MTSKYRWLFILGLGWVAGASLWLTTQTRTTGDWQADAWPAVHALTQGRVTDYLSTPVMMAPFATLIQAPFAALSGGSELEAYRWAAFPCLIAAGVLGLYLAGVGRRYGASRLTQVLISALCLVNPLTFEALRLGHPEELLTAALAVGAVATASEGHSRRTAVLLGLAIASKQWAAIAILPALMALPRRRVSAGLGALAIAVAINLPGLLVAPDSFLEVQHSAASAATGRFATPWSVWYPATTPKTEVHQVGGRHLVAHIREAPPFIGALSHPLVALTAFAIPMAICLRRRRFGLPGNDAMGLLALLFLLRCALDPVDNLYYHTPLLLALIGWDALAPRGLPLRAGTGAALALLFFHWSHNLSDPAAFNAAYLVIASLAVLAMLATLFGPRGWTGVHARTGLLRRLSYRLAWRGGSLG